jgi:hypothetical protein
MAEQYALAASTFIQDVELLSPYRCKRSMPHSLRRQLMPLSEQAEKAKMRNQVHQPGETDFRSVLSEDIEAVFSFSTFGAACDRRWRALKAWPLRN